MKIIIQTPGIKLSKRLAAFTQEKVEGLGRYHDQIVKSHVHLKKIKTGEPDNKICEIRLAIPGNDLFASKKAPKFEEAINKAIEAIKRQIGDRKIENQVSTPL